MTAYLCIHLHWWHETLHRLYFFEGQKAVTAIDPIKVKQGTPSQYWECLIFHHLPASPDELGMIECTECKRKFEVSVAIWKNKDYFGRPLEYPCYSFQTAKDPNWHLCEHLIEWQRLEKAHTEISISTEGYGESVTCSLCGITATWPDYAEPRSSN